MVMGMRVRVSLTRWQYRVSRTKRRGLVATLVCKDGPAIASEFWIALFNFLTFLHCLSE
jgi:hypothetical protein